MKHLLALLPVSLVPLLQAQPATQILQEYRICSVPGDWNLPKLGALSGKQMDALFGSDRTQVLSTPRVVSRSGEAASIEIGKEIEYLEPRGDVFVKKTSEEVAGIKLESTAVSGKNNTFLLHCVFSQFVLVDRLPLDGLDLPGGKPVFASRNNTTSDVAVRSGVWHLLANEQPVTEKKERILLLARLSRTGDPQKFKPPKALNIHSELVEHGEESSRFVGNVVADLGVFRLETDEMRLRKAPPAPPGQDATTQALPEQELRIVPLAWNREDCTLQAKGIRVRRGDTQLEAETGILKFGTAAAEPPAGNPTRLRMERLVIPEIKFVEARLEDVVQFLATRVKELEPDGPPLVFRVAGDKDSPRMNAHLANLPLWDVCRFLAEVAGRELDVGNRIVTFR